MHSKGLNIIGVSLDEDAADWKAAIAKDKLTWTQVSNLKKWKDPIALDYEVDQIPATFILDAKGNIVAKNLSGEELKAKIKEILVVKYQLKLYKSIPFCILKQNGIFYVFSFQKVIKHYRYYPK